MDATTPQPAPSWPLVGRDDELATLMADLSQTGTCHVVLAGSAGVGKTRLSRQALAELAGRGVAGIRVSGTVAAQSIPLGAFASVIQGPLPTGGGPLELMMAVSESVLARSAGALLVLAVDDAHLLDASSATLVGHLARTGRVSVIATVRSGAPCHDVIVNLWKDGDARRIELQALSATEVDELLGLALGGRIARATSAWMFRVSQGNPLFVRELVDSALTDGSLRQDDGLWQISGPLKPSMRLTDLVGLRFSGLDPAQRRVLELVALGEPLPLVVLEQLASEHLITELERVGLIRLTADGPGGALLAGLGHPLYGEVMRRAIGVASGRALLRELADALAARPSGRGDDELRIAAWLVDAGEVPPAELLITASGQAAAGLDHELAARLAEVAATDGTNLAAVVQAAGAHRRLGAFVRAEQLLADSESMAAGAGAGSIDLVRGYLFIRVATLHWGLGRLDQAVELLDRAMDWFPDRGWKQWVAAQRVSQLATGGRHKRAIDEGRTLLAATDLATATALPLAVGQAFALHQAGHVEEALDVLDRAVAASGESDSVDLPSDAMWAMSAIVGGLRWDEAERRLLRLRDSALARKDVATCGYAELLLGQLALARGDVAGAQDRLAEAEAHLTVQDSRGLLTSCRALRVAALGQAGRSDPEPASPSQPDAAAPPAPWIGAPQAAQAEIWAAASRGQYSAAQRLAVRFADRCRQAPLLRALALHDAVRVGARPHEVLGELRRAVALTDSPLAGACLTHVTALGRQDADGLAAAADQFSAVGAMLHAAEAATAAAVIYHRSSAPQASAAADRAARLRQQCPGADTPGLHSAADSAGLTQREREIAVLAGAGLTNAEIADRLVLSVRTVESHLYRASGKLGVSRREDLAGLL